MLPIDTPIDTPIDLKAALQQENPLQMVGVINAYCALLAEKAGFLSLYLSGAALSNSLGLPDLGMTTFTEVAEEIRKIKNKVQLPLLVDGDTGFGSHLTIQRMVREFIQAGANAVQLEDQNFPKRCGHLKGKVLVSKQEMGDRIKAALDARTHKNFLIVARTDAEEQEGIEAALERALFYQELGADIIFVEAVKALKDYQVFSQALTVPLLANMTEFGQTPLCTLEELKKVGVAIVLYPLSAFRAMNKAALEVFQVIRQEGSQAKVLAKMQTRKELYEILKYEDYRL